jgi:hypothetical protein
MDDDNWMLPRQGRAETVSVINKSLRMLNNLKLIDTNEKIVRALKVYNSYIIVLNGQERTDTQIDNTLINGVCPYLGNKPAFTIECKTITDTLRKAEIMNFLKDTLVGIFNKVDPELLLNTDPYVNELRNAIETYCFFIGSKHLKPIYADYVMGLVDELNILFPEPIIINRCHPTDRGYGCARIVYKVKRTTEPEPEANKYKILLLSTNNDGYNTNVQDGSNTNVQGGSRNRKRKSIRRQKNRTVRRKKY